MCIRDRKCILSVKIPNFALFGGCNIFFLNSGFWSFRKLIFGILAIWEIEFWILVSGFWLSGFWHSGFWHLGFCTFRILTFGILTFGITNSGFWTVILPLMNFLQTLLLTCFQDKVLIIGQFNIASAWNFDLEQEMSLYYWLLRWWFYWKFSQNNELQKYYL